MAWTDDLEEQMQRRWFSRLARERLDLSASVEATLEETSLHEGHCSDALETAPSSVQAAQKQVIIPPRLSLQSRLLPAVDKSPNGTRIYESSLALPIVPTPIGSPIMRSLPTSGFTEKHSSLQGKLQVPKRPTKVRLEAVSSQGTVAAKDTLTETEEQGSSAIDTLLFGSGTFESGRSDVAIINTAVQSSSVVMVMLAGDPGPVVVQYVTLRPQDGFTVHLSAPAQTKTPFNYMILSENNARVPPQPLGAGG